MDEEIMQLKVKRDQVFGLFVCVPEAKADQVGQALKYWDVEHSLAPSEAARLGVSGCTTLILHEPWEDLRLALALEQKLWRLDPALEELPLRYTGRIERLLALGDPRDIPQDSEFAAGSGFTLADVADLVRMMGDAELHGASSTSSAVWGPIHAINVLGALQAESAIDPLLAEWRRSETLDDDFLGEAVADALASIGPVTIDPAAKVLADGQRSQFVRCCAARTLAALANQVPEARERCLAALVAQLACHAEQDPEFNGLLVSALLDARAVEAEPEITRAYASGHVDDTIAGDIEDVQIELGLKDPSERSAKDHSSGGMLDRLFSPPAPYRAPPKIARNAPCPCGSGKKYKRCCGP